VRIKKEEDSFIFIDQEGNKINDVEINGILSIQKRGVEMTVAKRNETWFRDEHIFLINELGECIKNCP